MRRFLPCALPLALALLFLASFAITESALALSGTDATYYKTQTNFRSTKPRNRYDYNSRGLKRTLIPISATASGSLTTFDQRAKLFRDAYTERMLRAIDARRFTGTSRDQTTSEERGEFLREQQQRRIIERIDERQFTPQSKSYLPGRARKLRDVNPEGRGFPRTCVGLSATRFTRCLYEQQERK